MTNHLEDHGNSRDGPPAELAERWLGEAYELAERGWCQGVAAEDEIGIAVDPQSAAAVRWSPSGALVALWRRSGVDDEVGLRALQIANLALAAAVQDAPASWNDAPRRRQHEVLEAILRAVSLARDPVLFGGASGSFHPSPKPVPAGDFSEAA
jgi:hypothetical protein